MRTYELPISIQSVGSIVFSEFLSRFHGIRPRVFVNDSVHYIQWHVRFSCWRSEINPFSFSNNGKIFTAISCSTLPVFV